MGLDFFGYKPNETLTYYPGGDLGAGVSVTAYVDREQRGALHDGLVHQATIWIARGTDSGELNSVEIGQDKVLMKIDPYGSQVECLVVRMLAGDAYVWKLKVVR